MFQLKKVEKRFPGVHALKEIDFEIKRGEIVGLVGENGAGKSTLMKILYGSYQHDGGELLIGGKPLRFTNPRMAMDMGIGMVFQEQSLIPNLTVMENIFLGFEKQFIKYGIIQWREMAKAAKYQLAKVKLDIDPKASTSSLSFVQRQLVELAKVLTLEERVDGDLVILLDEPTSVLAKEEIELLFQIIRGLRSRTSFIFVSHRLDEVIEISDRIYVLKDGAVVDLLDRKDADVESIQHKMVGRDVDKEYYREEKQLPCNKDEASVLVNIDSISLSRKYKDISLTLHKGEVLTLAGVEGSGREDILRTIFGYQKPDTGTITVSKNTFQSYSPFQSVQCSVGYVPRERKVEGIVSGMTVYENMTLCQLGKYSKHGVLNKKSEHRLAKKWINKLSIKASSENADCGNLSGGNQQKVVLAKWRSAGSKIILLDHPTRGLDIGAKEDVYEMIRTLCADDIGVILVADTLEEAIGLSHTILVLKDGEIQKRFNCVPGSKPSLYDLIHYMI